MANPVVLTLTTSDPLHDYLQLYIAIEAISVGGGMAAANTDYIINFSTSGSARTLQLLDDLPAINLMSGSTLTFDGNSDYNNQLGGLDSSDIIDARGYQGFVVTSGKVTFKNLTIINAVASGGNGGVGGGGGGAGLGGGLFVGQNADVTLNNVNFGSNSAIGGNGGVVDPAGGGGGGGGIGADGGSGNGGGGGGGGFGGHDYFGDHGNGGNGYSEAGSDSQHPSTGAQTSGGTPATVVGPGGGQSADNYGGSGFGAHAAGGANGGGGAGGVGGGGGGIGGGNSVGGGPSGNIIGYGGAGGVGGGGGGGIYGGGNGGFAGGGGGSGTGSGYAHTGGNGGFGGGGGGSNGTPGTGGFGAGSGSLAGGGGGGLGAGGNIFVQQGGKLTVIGGSLMGATETGGTGANGAGNGSGYGDIFIQGTMVVTPTHTVSTLFEGLQTVTTLTIGDKIADERGISGSGTTGKLVVTGGGTLTLTGASSYVGGTQIDGGNIVSITADNNIGRSAGALILNAGGTLTTTGGYSFTHAIQLTNGGGTFDVSSGTISATSSISGSGTFTLSGAGTLQLGMGQLAGLTGTFGLSSTHLSLTSGGTFDDTLSLSGNSILSIANGVTVTDTALVTGGGNLGIDGGGTLALGHAANSYGNTTISSGTVWVTAAGAAGTGTISFTSGIAGTLKIDNAALSGNAFTNTIANFNPGQSIDLTGLQYNTQTPSLNTVSLSGNTLSVSNGTTTDTLTLAGVGAGTSFQLSQDANGGTIVQVVSTRVFNVANVAQLNAAILQMDSGGQNAAPNANYTINITANFSLTSELYALNLLSGSSVTINGSDGHGGGYTIDGLNAQRGFFVYSGNVNLENLTIQNTVAAGGGVVRGGGGGGAGLGGALFVASNGSATIDNVTFHNSAAIGGNGGAGGTGNINSGYGFGGGGGMGGRGGSTGGGGIGLDAQGADSDLFRSGAPGIVPNTAGGGKGSPGYLITIGGGQELYWYGGSGGANGGGGGATGWVASGVRAAYAPGGGIGGANGADGGKGGFGGGGGDGADGGFGGGGGYNGDGGFGGGGGIAGVGGFGGGNGTSGGGGGLGAGGTVFVQQGGSLTIKSGSLSDDTGFNAVKGGTNGIGQASGSAYGSGIFIQGNNTLSFAPDGGETLTIANDIADQTGSGGTAANAGTGGVAISGGGTVVLGGNNSYTGNTTVSGTGTFVSISANVNLGAVSSILKLGDGTGISFTDGFTQTHNITVAGDPVFNVAAGEVVTQSGVISDGASAGDVEVTGGGRLVLAAHNTYSGGTVVKGSILELAANGAAGTGAIAFTDGSAEKLVIDAAAFSGSSFTTSITGFAGGDTIDFTNIAYSATATLSYSNGVLLVKSSGGTTLASLNLSFGAGGSAASLVLASDGAATPHLELRSEINITSVTADTTGHLTLLNTGKVVTITVNFSTAVNVTGAPELVLNDGRAATYVGGSGSQALVFSYTVLSGDATPDLKVLSLALNGGTIRDPAGQDALLDHAATDLHLVIDGIAPTVSVTTSQTSLLAGQIATVTFTFSEAVIGFALTDATVSGGALSNLVHVGVNGLGQDVYTATFTPDVTNTEAGSVQVNASSYADSAGNTGAASNTVSFTGDTLAPTVSIAADHATLHAGDAAVVTFTFSEAVTGFALSDATVSGGGLSNLVHVGVNADGNDIYTAVFTPDPANAEMGSVKLNASSYADNAGNAGAASNSISFSGDTLAPTLAVTADRTALLAGQTATVTFTFSEAVASFVLGDVAVQGGILGNLSHVGINGAGQDVYTATFTPDASNASAGSVQVGASAYADVAGNSGAPSNSVTFTGDTLAPSVLVTMNPDTVLAGQNATVTFTFSEAVTGFGLGGTTVHGGTLDSLVHVGLNGAGEDVYTATFIPDVANAETGSVQVSAASYADAAGNAGTVSNVATVDGDTLVPTVSVTADHTVLTAGDTALVTFTFSEAVAGFTLDDVTVQGGALDHLIHVGINGAGEDVYTAILTPDADNAETGSVQVIGAGYTDAAGNSGTASNAVGFTGDTLAPTVAVAASPGTVLAGQNATVTFTFSEAVTGFALSDTTVSGGVLDNLVHVGVNGAGRDVYTATFTPDINDVVAGSVRVNAASYGDSAGNAGSASNTASIGGDTLAPTVSIAADHTALLADDTALLTFTFSEVISGFTLGDLSVTGGQLDHLVHLGFSLSGEDIYAATFTPDASNSEVGSVQVDPSGYTDVAGNAGAASNTVNFSGDTLAPTASVVATPSTLLAGQTSLVTFTFSEAVTGFTRDNIIVHGGTLSGLTHVGLSGAQDVYSAVFTPDASNSEAGSVQVDAASYTDAAGNAGAASNTAHIGGDTRAPTVVVTADHSSLLADQTALLTFTFSDRNPAFALHDVTVHGGALGQLAHVGLNGAGEDIYTATFTPDASDALSASVQVKGASFTDAAGNSNAASNTVSFDGDTKAPAAPRLALHQDSGISGTDHVTSNPLIDYVKSDAADSLQYRVDGAASFSNDVPTALTDGVHTVSIQEIDPAGNVSAVASLTFTLDTTAPHVAGISATPSGGFAKTGSTVQLTLGFDEAVNVSGGTPTLTLNDGGKAIYDAAATALLGDSSKLVFDHVVSATNHVSALSVTGFVANGAVVNDIAGNAADLSTVSAAFDALHINETTAPAFTIGGITRPELHFNESGQIMLDAAASAFMGQYGIEYLYLGLPPGTPYPPVDMHV
ncbi:Ig-like domain-containing protein [Bradyrhizobium ivorense]|uniref:Ig-like domain-containing protein n=1 Tax=Bradyrhizobium ivorense TaxID=2511166 RepID=UPI0010B7314D|nr:Ig-like domain-containing protein [Bradyrhizobium ivorense]VIO70303.1 Adhesin BmaC autotransporter [Bradyrhizobium ivorense]